MLRKLEAMNTFCSSVSAEATRPTDCIIAAF
jgi:hypothetical protein